MDKAIKKKILLMVAWPIIGAIVFGGVGFVLIILLGQKNSFINQNLFIIAGVLVGLLIVKSKL